MDPEGPPPGAPAPPPGQGWGTPASPSWPPTPQQPPAQDGWQQPPSGDWAEQPTGWAEPPQGADWQQQWQQPQPDQWQQQSPPSWPPQQQPEWAAQQAPPPPPPPPGAPPSGTPPTNWNTPYPGQSGGIASPPRTGRGSRLAIIVVVLVVVLVGGGIGLAFALKGSNASPSANGTTPPSPTPASTAGTASPLPTATNNLNTAAPQPPSGLTAAAVFPSAQLYGNNYDNVTIQKVTTLQSADCTKMLPATARPAFAQAGCDQVIAGTYKTSDGRIDVTIALYEVSSPDAAKTIAMYDTNLFGDLSNNTLPGLGPSGPTSEPNGDSTISSVSTRYVETAMYWLTNGQATYQDSTDTGGKARSVLQSDVVQHLPPAPPQSQVVGVAPAPSFASGYLFYGTRVPGALGGFDMTRKATTDSTSCASRLGPALASQLNQAGCRAVASALYQTVDGRMDDSISVFSVGSATAAKNLSDNMLGSDDRDTNVVQPLTAPGVTVPAQGYVNTDYTGTYLVLQVVWYSNGASPDNVSPLINMDVGLLDPTQQQLFNLPGGQP